MERIITSRLVHDLELHPLQSHLGEPDDDEAWKGFCEALDAAGPDGIPPIIITPDGQIMDGGRRWRAAAKKEWDEINCVVRHEYEAATIIADSLFGQRDLTKASKLYILLDMMDDFVKSANSRRVASLDPTGRKISEKPLCFSKSQVSRTGHLVENDSNVRAFCARIGLPKTEYYRVLECHDLFYDPKCARLAKFYEKVHLQPPPLAALQKKQKIIRDESEPQLIRGLITPWKILSTVGGGLSELQDRKEENAKQKKLERWEQALLPFQEHAQEWEELSTTKKSGVLDKWREAAAAMTPQLRKALIDVLKAA